MDWLRGGLVGAIRLTQGADLVIRCLLDWVRRGVTFTDNISWMHHPGLQSQTGRNEMLIFLTIIARNINGSTKKTIKNTEILNDYAVGEVSKTLTCCIAAMLPCLEVNSAGMGRLHASSILGKVLDL